MHVGDMTHIKGEERGGAEVGEEINPGEIHV